MRVLRGLIAIVAIVTCLHGNVHAAGKHFDPTTLVLRLSDLRGNYMLIYPDDVTGPVSIRAGYNEEFKASIGPHAPGGFRILVAISTAPNQTDKQALIDSYKGASHPTPWQPTGIGDWSWGSKNTGNDTATRAHAITYYLRFWRGLVQVELSVVGTTTYLQPAEAGRYARTIDARLQGKKVSPTTLQVGHESHA